MNCAAAASLAPLAGSIASEPLDANEKKTLPKCKIKVVKKVVYQDLYVKFTGKKGKICSVFEEGQEFVVKSPYSPPKGFCAWAWADIRPSIHSVFFGGRKNSIVCCTDGYRPVVFNVERIG